MATENAIRPNLELRAGRFARTRRQTNAPLRRKNDCPRTWRIQRSAPAAPLDPLDLNPPLEAWAEELQTTTSQPTPARATVRVPSNTSPPLAPPTEESPQFAEDPPLSAPRPVSKNENPFPPVPEPPAASVEAPQPSGTMPPQTDTPFPNATMPSVQGPETGLTPKGPECAVPVAAASEIPANDPAPQPKPAFVDPLDQLTFPDAEPSSCQTGTDKQNRSATLESGTHLRNACETANGSEHRQRSPHPAGDDGPAHRDQCV